MPSQVGVVATGKMCANMIQLQNWPGTTFSTVFILFGRRIGMLQFTEKTIRCQKPKNDKGTKKIIWDFRWPRWVCYISIHLRRRMLRTSGSLPTRRPLAASVRGGHHNEALLRTRRGKKLQGKKLIPPDLVFCMVYCHECIDLLKSWLTLTCCEYHSDLKRHTYCTISKDAGREPYEIIQWIPIWGNSRAAWCFDRSMSRGGRTWPCSSRLWGVASGPVIAKTTRSRLD